MQEEQITDARHQEVVEDGDPHEDQLLALRCQQHAIAMPHPSMFFHTTDLLTTLLSMPI